MKTLNKIRFQSLLLILLLVAVMAIPTTGMATQQTVNLGTASGFAILAGDTIANLGVTTINGSAGGNVGLFPGTVFSGQWSVSVTGAIHLNDAVASQAKSDLTTAYDDAAGRTPVTRIPTQLGGTTLTPGTYDSEDGLFRITGTLTLDAQGDPDAVFIFKTNANLLTDADSNVSLINSAQPCRVFWKVGGAVALGTNSHFEGNILALISIRVMNGATVQGRLLARNGSVTLNNNSITADVCPPKPAPAILNVIKHVINDDGGTAGAGDFSLHVTTVDGSDVENSPAPGVEAPGTAYTLPAGTYVVSEDEVAGYTASYSGDSDSSGKITLSPGENKTVTITNDDSKWKKIPLPAILSVVKYVINDNGGTAGAGDFNIHVRTVDGSEVENSPAPGVEAPGTIYTLPPGTYVVSEDAVAGYTASYSGDSDSSGNITLYPGDNKTVTITNDDIPFKPPSEATLHVIKHVINDSGGTAVAGDFNLHVKTTSGNEIDGSPAPGVEAPGTTYTLAAGTYVVSEDAVAGYTASYSGDSDSSGKITLNPGDNKTVTITNDDIPFQPPKVTPTPVLDFTYGYINGYDTGNVGAEDPLTREEVCASLYRIVKQAGKITGYTKPAVSDFTDLATNRWSYAAVEYMVSIGAIPKGAIVKPTEPVTRGEMAKIIAISNKMTNNESIVKFPDLPDSHMYYDYLNMLVNNGLIKGYPDGQIKPDGLITRAEYVTMVNRFIGRDNRYYVSGLPSLYKDLLPTHWAFADIQRASFGFTTTVDSNGFFQVDPAQKISKAALDN